MKALLFVTLLLVGTLAHTDSDLRSLFSAWKNQHGKVYADEVEEEYRFNVFTSTYNFIQQYNSEGHRAVLGLNQFSDLTTEEFGSLFTGAHTIPAEEATVQNMDNIEYPSDWNWYPQAVTSIKNQGQCGSCWAFASVAVSESAYYFTSGQLVDFSEQQVVDCDTNCDGCNGGYPYYALQYIASSGLEYSDEYPYVAVQQACQYNQGDAITTSVTGAVIVNSQGNAAALMAAIYQQPTVVLVQANQAVFQSYTSGVIGSDCGDQLDHAITAVGYTGSYFIIKNSWGPAWGQEGFVWISTESSDNGGMGACGILTQPVYPTF